MKGFFGCFWMLALCFSNVTGATPVVFEKRKITLGKQTLTVEIADNEAKWQLGLMHRKSLDPNHGMLFVFPDHKPRNFWMKNTFIDLSIGFFDQNQRLVEVGQMLGSRSILQKEVSSYQSQSSAQFVLEVNNGWFDRHNVNIGASFKWLDRPNAIRSKN